MGSDLDANLELAAQELRDRIRAQRLEDAGQIRRDIARMRVSMFTDAEVERQIAVRLEEHFASVLKLRGGR